MNKYQKSNLIRFANHVKQSTIKQHYKELMKSGIPVLLGLPSNKHHPKILIYCKYCMTFHDHVNSIGIQDAGCTKDVDSPYSKTGYYIELIKNLPPITDLIFKDMLGSMREITEIVLDEKHKQNSDLR